MTKQIEQALNKHILPYTTLLGILLALGINTGCQQVSVSAGTKKLKVVEVTVVDPNGTGYGTFQSHNQKIVSNANGIFITYLHYFDKETDEQKNIWHLARSTDRGKTFETIYEGVHPTRAPAIETDAQNNIYLSHSSYNSPGDYFYFYRFLASKDYKEPLISTFFNQPCAAKFAMTYDEKRQQFYIATQFGKVLTVGTDGVLRQSKQLLTKSSKACPQYPHLKMDAEGNLHHGWTTALLDKYGYRSIHHMLSADGAKSWENLDGTQINFPCYADETGQAKMINLPDELEVNTWLSSMLPKDGKVHFRYDADAKIPKMHYMRYDIATGQREIDSWKDFPDNQWRGDKIILHRGNGFFAADSDVSGSTLYAIAQDSDDYIACLASDDNGDTWYDFARSKEKYNAYAMGGCGEITDDGLIIGSFTDSNTKAVSFLKIQTATGR